MRFNKNKVFWATFWSFAGVSGRHGILLVVGIILARILEPEDFGLIGMIMVFLNMGQIFLNLGLGKAIIQDQEATPEDISTIFYFNLLLGVCFALSLYFASPLVALVYQQPRLEPLAGFVALTFVFNAFVLVPRSLLVKKLSLKKESVVICVASLLSGAIAVYLALQGYGVWALAVKLVLQSGLEAIFYWIFHPWQPLGSFSFASLRRYLKFSLNVTAASALHMFRNYSDMFVIGVFCPAAQLGFYERAKNFSEMAHRNLGWVFEKVLFSVLSNLQGESDRFERAYRSSLRMVSFCVIPLFLGLIVLAEPLIVVLLTEKWLPSVYFLQIFAASGCVYPLSTLMLNAILSRGKSGVFFLLDLAKTVLFILAIGLGIAWDIYAVAWAVTIVAYLNFCLNFYLASRVTGIKIRKHLTDILLPFLNSLLMLAGLSLFARLQLVGEVAALFAYPAVGILIYFAAMFLTRKERILELKNFILRAG